MSKEWESEQALLERWSAKAKTGIVLRLFRGERVDAVSRDIQVPVHETQTWFRFAPARVANTNAWDNVCDVYALSPGPEQGRRIIYRLLSYNPWLKDFFAAWELIRRLKFT